MSLADTQYLQIIENILEHGTFGQNRTGVATYKLPHQIMQFDLQEEFPILTTKFVAFKTAVKELLWIWQMQSNDVRKLQDMNVRVWDKWMREDGTIGKAYGYQIAKYKQLDNLINTIKHDVCLRVNTMFKQICNFARPGVAQAQKNRPDVFTRGDW